MLSVGPTPNGGSIGAHTVLVNEHHLEAPPVAFGKHGGSQSDGDTFGPSAHYNEIGVRCDVQWLSFRSCGHGI